MKEGQLLEKFFIVKSGKRLEVTLRTTRRSDVTELKSHRNALVRENAFIGQTKNVTTPEQKRKTYEHLRKAREGKSIVIIAETGGEMIGTAGGQLGHGAKSHTVDVGITTAREYRKLGLGKKMMQLLMKLAKKEMKAELMTLTVCHANLAALNLYENLGFQKAGKIKKGLKFAGKYYDEIHMVKKL